MSVPLMAVEVLEISTDAPVLEHQFQLPKVCAALGVFYNFPHCGLPQSRKNGGVDFYFKYLRENAIKLKRKEKTRSANLGDFPFNPICTIKKKFRF